MPDVSTGPELSNSGQPGVPMKHQVSEMLGRPAECWGEQHAFSTGKRASPTTVEILTSRKPTPIPRSGGGPEPQLKLERYSFLGFRPIQVMLEDEIAINSKI